MNTKGMSLLVFQGNMNYCPKSDRAANNDALPFLTETDEWSFGPSMNNKRSNVGCVTLLNEDDQPTIMVGGGFNRFKLQETTEFLASGASQWTVGPNLPRRSKDTTLVRLPNKQGVAMIGGMGSAAGENYLSVMQSSPIQ